MVPTRKSLENCRTVASKLPSDLIAQLDQIAGYRCTSRSFLIRELAEAAVDGRVYLDLLRAGGSRSPEELGEIVGVDLTDPGFWSSGLNLIERRLGRAEATVA
jgi:predicted transcriptional regulator